MHAGPGLEKGLQSRGQFGRVPGRGQQLERFDVQAEISKAPESYRQRHAAYVENPAARQQDPDLTETHRARPDGLYGHLADLGIAIGEEPVGDLPRHRVAVRVDDDDRRDRGQRDGGEKNEQPTSP